MFADVTDSGALRVCRRHPHLTSETLEPMATPVDQQQLAEQLLAQAKEQGVELVGPNGLL